jgi:hypothetical protein
MARTGKITIYVNQGMHTQSLSIRTTGKSGSVALNTISVDIPYTYRTSAPDALTFWTAILNLAIAGL